MKSNSPQAKVRSPRFSPDKLMESAKQSWLDKLAAERPKSKVPRGYFNCKQIGERLGLTSNNARLLMQAKKAKMIQVKTGRIIENYYSL